jgi:hypothetical protein
VEVWFSFSCNAVKIYALHNIVMWEIVVLSVLIYIYISLTIHNRMKNIKILDTGLYIYVM